MARKTSGYRLPDPSARQLLDRLAERRQRLGAFRARANERRSKAERIADRLTQVMGSVPFLIFHTLLFAAWLGVNLGIVKIVPQYDPFPFGLLTMALTLEQSLLTIFIIMSQNRASEIADLRNEIDLQVNIVAEEEISKALRLLRLIGQRLEIDEIINDPELALMEEPLDHAEMEKQTQRELADEAPAPIPTASEWTPH
ncbi:MAG: DUF1003 domain-containing protein [Anaerolineae bacterium]|nr:DUF1003 domain-containing protein [Anaerolineae bacterium]